MLLDIIQQGDLCSLLGVILILVVLGCQVSAERQRRWGLVLALLAFLAAGAQALAQTPPGNAEDLFHIALRSLILFGLVLGLSWIILPLLAGAASLLWSYLGAPPARRRPELATAQPTVTQSSSTLTTNSVAAEQERHAQAEAQAQAQQRRADARAACEVLFSRHEPDIKDRFARDTFNDFLQRYLGDDQPPEQVEQRARQLQEVILHHVGFQVTPQQPYSLKSLAAWYQQTRDLINNLPVEERYKQTQLAGLNARYAELIEKLMENLQP